AGACLTTGFLLQRLFTMGRLFYRQSLLVCGVAWFILCLFAALPFSIGAGMSYLDAYFESVSGFTTTGITVITAIEGLPKSILFWRSLIQWLGGLGILTLFLAITFRSNGAYFQLFSAEAHKIDSARPTPNIYRTAAMLWSIYAGFTLLEAIILKVLGLSVFDSICHALTTLSTGGFSTYNASIDYFRQAGYQHYRLIEYTITFFMLVGGVNFLLHFKILTGRFREVISDIEFRAFIAIVLGVSALILLDRTIGLSENVFAAFEENFRKVLFTVSAVITTTGFGTVDINSNFFPALSKQLFLVLMLIGGSVGSTAGGIKVLRMVILGKLFKNQIRRLRLPKRALSQVIIDHKIFPDDEIRRITGLFFGWLLLILAGGGITALFADLDAWQSFSGMFSAVGNIGPAYFSVQEMSQLPGIVKLTYILGMLAGRLEILPVLLIFSPRAWRR
ncbi:MAG: TrkH family potassium uptake protein, partial [Spirochaetales bacterium]|nr:TrkH family potassium uptake protein [Spirochaetales bacterium]